MTSNSQNITFRPILVVVINLRSRVRGAPDDEEEYERRHDPAMSCLSVVRLLE